MEANSVTDRAQAPVEVGQNVQVHRAGKKLVIIVDLAAAGRPSASGKTVVIGSTRGNVPVPNTNGVYLGANIFGYDGYSVDDV